MTTAIRCAGVRADAPEYSAELVAFITPIIREVRRCYRTQDGQLCGARFNTDELVLLSMRSAASEEAVRMAPLSWAHAALEDCATRDYHYAYDKEWAEPFDE